MVANSLQADRASHSPFAYLSSLITGEEIDQLLGVLEAGHEEEGVWTSAMSTQLSNALGESGERGWTRELASKVVGLVEDLATQHPDLLTKDRVARLMPPLQDRVITFIMGATA